MPRSTADGERWASRLSARGGDNKTGEGRGGASSWSSWRRRKASARDARSITFRRRNCPARRVVPPPPPPPLLQPLHFTPLPQGSGAAPGRRALRWSSGHGGRSEVATGDGDRGDSSSGEERGCASSAPEARGPRRFGLFRLRGPNGAADETGRGEGGERGVRGDRRRTVVSGGVGRRGCCCGWPLFSTGREDKGGNLASAAASFAVSDAAVVAVAIASQAATSDGTTTADSKEAPVRSADRDVRASFWGEASGGASLRRSESGRGRGSDTTPPRSGERCGEGGGEEDGKDEGGEERAAPLPPPPPPSKAEAAVAEAGDAQERGDSKDSDKGCLWLVGDRGNLGALCSSAGRSSELTRVNSSFKLAFAAGGEPRPGDHAPPTPIPSPWSEEPVASQPGGVGAVPTVTVAGDGGMCNVGRGEGGEADANNDANGGSSDALMPSSSA